MDDRLLYWQRRAEAAEKVCQTTDKAIWNGSLLSNLGATKPIRDALRVWKQTLTAVTANEQDNSR